MSVAALVQARMTSSRLPGKVLRPLAGRPLLAWLIDALEGATSLDCVVVATSVDVSDDAIAAWCADRGVACVRGSLDDVARRLADAATASECDLAIRLSGDSPLLDPMVVERVLAAFDPHEVDVVTNVRPRTYPVGQSVEVVPTDLLRRAADEMSDARHREHVVPWFYEQPDRFRVRNVAHTRDLSAIRMVVDTPADARAVEGVLVAIAEGGRAPAGLGVDGLAALFGG